MKQNKGFTFGPQEIKANTNWIGINQKIKKEYPLGKSTPWIWVIEPHFGCNLDCGHCCNFLIKKENYHAMDENTWTNTFKIINEVSPTIRVDITGFVGEPTLHPELLKFITIARGLVPKAQIQLTTNGTNIINGKYKMADFFNAGINSLYIDQYGNHDIYEKLAEESGYPWYQYYNKPEEAPSPWVYCGSELKVIVLMEEPSTWPKSRKRANVLGNWFNNLDWERGKEFNMYKLEKPLVRRCNMPFTYVALSAQGNYLMCCQDGMHITGGTLGNVNEGVDGFKKFWFGKEMQMIRKNLRNKNRAGIENCNICNATFSKCDYIYWKHDDLNKYWDGTNWQYI